MGGLLSSVPDTWLPVQDGSRPTMTHAHKEIHQGNHYTVSHDVTVGTGTAVTVLIETGTAGTGYVHAVFGVTSDKAFTWTLSEAPNTSGGTTLVSYNNNRTSSNTSPATFTHTATYVSSGTILDTGRAGTALPQSTLGGGADARNEWILEAETLYLVRVVALAATTAINVQIPYYVED